MRSEQLSYGHLYIPRAQRRVPVTYFMMHSKLQVTAARDCEVHVSRDSADTPYRLHEAEATADSNRSNTGSKVRWLKPTGNTDQQGGNAQPSHTPNPVVPSCGSCGEVAPQVPSKNVEKPIPVFLAHVGFWLSCMIPCVRYPCSTFERS